MQVFFSAPVKGTFPMWDEIYMSVLQAISQQNAIFRTQHNPLYTAPTIRRLSATQDGLTRAYDQAVYDQAANWLSVCDCMIAECSNPAIEIGLHMGLAVARGLDVLVLHKEGTHLPQLVSGCPFVQACMFEDVTDIGIRVSRFLNDVAGKLER